MRVLLAVCLSTLVACSPAVDSSSPTGSFDLFASSPLSAALPPNDPALVKPGSIVQVEPRLGVPTFVWATPSAAPGVPLSQIAPSEAEAAARAHLLRYGRLYGTTSEATINTARLLELHDTGRGGLIARFGQEIGGIEVFRDELKVLLARDLSLVAIAGYLPNDLGARPFQLTAAMAIAAAARDARIAVDPADLVLTGQVGGNYTRYEAPGSALRPVRIKPVYFHLPAALEPAFYLELEVPNAENQGSDPVSYVISGLDGRLLFRNPLTVDASFSYRTWAQSVSPFTPMDGPQGFAPTPHPTGLPDGYQAPFQVSSLITLANSPFGTNDPWLIPGASEANGNNAEAYLDLFAPDGFTAGDFRIPVSGPGVFDYVVDFAVAPNFVQPNGARTQQLAAGTALFYTVNFLHDMFYDSGFNEIAGNGQALNYGRGGLESDALKLEAQDFSGRNNANMSTPADGARPRMQMFLFDGLAANKVTALTPGSLAGDYTVGVAGWGPTSFLVTGTVVRAVPNDGCAPLTNAVAGKIAFIDRGVCGFVNKVEAAQAAGAIGVIIANVAASGSPTIAPGMGGVPAGPVNIPSLSLNVSDGDLFRAAFAAEAVTAVLKRPIALDRDASLDATTIAHEWGHYISNRLVGNANGLSTNLSRGLGEGWGDFHAMLLTVRPEDSLAPGNSQFNGVYAMGAFSTPSFSANPYYFGFRRYPYSTDLTKNPLTYKHIANGEPLPIASVIPHNAGTALNAQVHNVGEIWAVMLWECYTALLRDVVNNTSGRGLTFAQAQLRMKDYLIAGYKMTPSAPTLLEARDALLAAAYAGDVVDYRLFSIAFAKRGAGANAVSPDRYSSTNIGAVEDATPAIGLSLLGSAINDAIASPCANGLIQNGETGLLSVTLKSSLAAALPGSTATISSSTPGVSFPNGTTLTFPAAGPLGTTTTTVQVSLAGVTGLKLDFSLNVNNTATGAAVMTFSTRANEQINSSVSATDDVESARQIWTPINGWQRIELSPMDHRMFGPDLAVPSDVQLLSPPLQVAPTGNFGFTFRHRFQFEGATPTFFDGAVIEITANNGASWQDVGAAALTPSYGGTLATAGGNPLEGRSAFVGSSASYPALTTQTVALGTQYQGQTVRVRFRIGSDQGTSGSGWELDDLSFTGILNTPFDTVTLSPAGCQPNPTAPIANPGPPQSVAQNVAVTLNGSASTTPNGGSLAFTWTQVGGPSAALTGPTTAQPTFTSPAVTAASTTTATSAVLTFSLRVTDSVATSQPALTTVTVVNPNRVPVAIAGSAQTVNERELVTLNGSATDADTATILTYAWTQTAGPAVSLSSASVAKPTFTAVDVSADTTLTFQLVASDSQVSSAPATVNVVVKSVNRPPVANAGAAQSVAERATANLSGASSSDPDGDSITFAWTQTAGPTVGLVGATTASPSFATPEVTADTAFTFQLVVNDGAANSPPSTVTVVVTNGNLAPIANAGPAQIVNERTVVTLNGSASSDPDGSSLTYLWTQTAGTAVAITGATTAAATFTAPEVTGPAVLTFQLVVNDGATASPAATVNVTVNNVNRVPDANAGTAQTVAERSTAVLDGSASSDPDGDALSFAWVQLTGPTVGLIGASTASASFVAPEVTGNTTLTFRLVVSDTAASSPASTVSVVVTNANLVPVANAGLAQTVDERTTVTLDASASADPEGGAVTYLWTQTAGPTVSLTGPTTAAPTFVAPEVIASTMLTFSLVVNDGTLASAAATVNVTVRNLNRAPVANAGAAVTVAARVVAKLNGTASADPDGDALTYLWVQSSGPEVALVGATSAEPTFTADVKVDSTFTFQLVVSDGTLLSAPSMVTVTVTKANRVPVANAGAAGEVGESNTFTLNGGGSADPDGDPLTYTWTQLEGPSVSLTGADSAAPTFTAPAGSAGKTLVFQLVVSDGTTASAPATVSVTVTQPGGGCGGCSTGAGAEPLLAMAMAGLLLAHLRRRKRS